jgi:hypothetical protein
LFVASLSSISGASQNGWQQYRLQEAQRNADQAAQTAQALKVQANDAQRVAQRAKENARSLAVDSSQADSRAGQARAGVASLRSAQEMVAQLSNFADQSVSRQQSSASSSSTPSAATNSTTSATSTALAPVINTQGQVTGTTISTTA